MTTATCALVLLSAAGHAAWNYLLKKAGGSDVFLGLSKAAEAVMLLPFLILATDQHEALVQGWRLPVVGAALVAANYVLLAAAYARADLSFVYPISRGAALVFLPPLAWLTLGEAPDAIGRIAIATIVLGILSLQSAKGGRPDALAVALALLAALSTAGYTLWDKHAVATLEPLPYYASYSVLVGIGYAAYLARTAEPAALRAVWRAQRTPILQVGILNSAAYLLVLQALRSGNASYVIALRQLSIAGGALLGHRLLGESLPLARRVGVALIVAGCVLVTLAR